MNLPKPIHPFPARMAASIPWEELQPGTNAEQLTVLDPMVGSGTTVVVARSLGYRAIGFDLDPLAVLIASTWAADIDPDATRRAASRLLDGRGWLAIPHRLAYPVEADEETRKFVRYWFDPKHRRQLAILSRRIARVEDKAMRSVLWCALSRLIIVKQCGVSLAMDVSHSRPHRVYDDAPLDAFEGFLPAVEKVLAASPFASTSTTKPDAVVKRGDARKLPLKDNSIDVVITSPPYLNAIDYIRGHRMSLVWMRHALADLRMIRSTSVGTEVSADTDAALTSHLDAMGGGGLEPRQQGMLYGYLRDMRSVVSEIARVLKPGGRAVLVVGDCAIRGTFVQNSVAIERLATASGLSLKARTVRDLPENRRYLPPPTHNDAGDQLQKRMRQEVILTLEAA
jgi:DNA modification methylase